MIKEEQKYTVKDIAKVVTLILAIWIFATVSCEDEKTVEKPEEPKFGKIEAYGEVKAYVLNQLVSPSTADFPWFDDSFVTQIDDTTFAVRGYVDSQNGYGATIRSTFGSKVLYHPKTKLAEIDYITTK